MNWQQNPDAVATYVRSIENWFIEIRGRGVQWSPADGMRAQSWYAVGVPLGTALRVLDARVRAWRFSHGAGAQLPMHLHFYEPALLQHCQQLRRIGGGAPGMLALASELPVSASDGQPSSETTLSDLLDELPALIAAAAHPGLAHAYRKAFALLDKALHPLQGTGEADLAGADQTCAQPEAKPLPAPGGVAAWADGQLDAVLDRCRALLGRTLLQVLTADEAAVLAQGVDAQLTPFRGQLSKKAMAGRRAALCERALADRFDLRLATRRGWQRPCELQ